MQIVVHNAAQVVVQMRKLTNGVVEIVNGTGTNARFQVGICYWFQNFHNLLGITDPFHV